MAFDERGYIKYLERLLDREISEKEKEAVEKLGAPGRLLISHTPRKKEASGVFSVHAYGDLIKYTLFKTPGGRAPAPPRGGVSEAEPDGGAAGVKDDKRGKGRHPAPPREGISETEPERGRTGGRTKTNLSRARARVFELAMCNEFSYFCTFTIDEKKRNRFDLPGFRKSLAMLVRNLNRDRSEAEKIKYLMIPEKHKNGAFHMHGMFAGLTDRDLTPFTLSQKLPKEIRARIVTGETVYNWERYASAFGFFTGTEIKNKTATAKYITKYLTKELGAAVEKEGGHLFYASQGLKKRETILWREVWDHQFSDEEWDYENEYVKVRWIDPAKMS